MKKFYFIILFFLFFLFFSQNVFAFSFGQLDYSDTFLDSSIAGNWKHGNIFEFSVSPAISLPQRLSNIQIRYSSLTSPSSGSLKIFLFALSDFSKIPYDYSQVCHTAATRYMPFGTHLRDYVLASTTISYNYAQDSGVLNFNFGDDFQITNSGYYYVFIDSFDSHFYLLGQNQSSNCQDYALNNLYFTQGIFNNFGADFADFYFGFHWSDHLYNVHIYSWDHPFFQPYYLITLDQAISFSSFFTLNSPISTVNYPFPINFTLNISVFRDLFPDYSHLSSFKLLINYCNKKANTTSTYTEACVPGTIRDSILNYNVANITYHTGLISDVLYSGPAILWVSVLTPDYYPIYVSGEYNFTVSSSVSIPPMIADYFSASAPTSTIFNFNTTGICSPPSDGFLSAPIENISYAICKTFSFLFIPSDDQRSYLRNVVFPSFMYSLRDAFPFQYIVQIYDSFVNTINYNPYSGEIVLTSASPPHINFRISGKDLTMPLTISSSSPFYSLYTYSQNISKFVIYFIMVDLLLLMFIF